MLECRATVEEKGEGGGMVVPGAIAVVSAGRALYGSPLARRIRFAFCLSARAAPGHKRVGAPRRVRISCTI